MKQAVCFLFTREDGKVLAISRFKKSGVVQDYGFPGGKVEEGETLRDAVVREVLEETGLKVVNPVELYTAEDHSRSMVTTFTGEVEDLNVLASSEEGEVLWVSRAELMSDFCTYRYYNTNVFFAAVGVRHDVAHHRETPATSS